MSLRLITRSPAIYQLWPLILAINSLSTALAITRPYPVPGRPRMANARAILRLRQVLIPRDQPVSGLVTSLAPRFCIASPPFRFLPHTDNYSPDTAASLQARGSSPYEAQGAAQAPARPSRRHHPALPAARTSACAATGIR